MLKIIQADREAAVRIYAKLQNFGETRNTDILQKSILDGWVDDNCVVQELARARQFSRENEGNIP